jgi:hypothetical protein
MGTVKMRAPIRAAIEDEWQRRATAAAIESARKLIGVDGTIKPGTPVGKLSDHELGWIISTGICAWISKRAEQATAEGFSLSVIEEAIRDTGTIPQPWDAGAVATILPKLADVPGIDWSLPLDEWPREMMLTFLCAGFDLVRKAMAARDAGGTITRPHPSSMTRDRNLRCAIIAPTCRRRLLASPSTN